MPDHPVATVRRALTNVQSAVTSGALARVCSAHNIRVVTQFGSSVSSPIHNAAASPGDVDIAYLLPHESSGMQHLLAIDALAALFDSDAVDIMDLQEANDVAFYSALMGGKHLFESGPGVFSELQIYAMRRYHDTQWYRDARRRHCAA